MSSFEREIVRISRSYDPLYSSDERGFHPLPMVWGCVDWVFGAFLTTASLFGQGKQQRLRRSDKASHCPYYPSIKTIKTIALYIK